MLSWYRIGDGYNARRRPRSGFEVFLEEVIFEQDAVLECLMPAFDFVLRPVVLSRRAPDVLDRLLCR